MQLLFDFKTRAEERIYKFTFPCKALWQEKKSLNEHRHFCTLMERAVNFSQFEKT